MLFLVTKQALPPKKDTHYVRTQQREGGGMENKGNRPPLGKKEERWEG